MHNSVFINLLLQAWTPSSHVWSNWVSPASPQFLNQAPPRAQQLRLSDFLTVPHLGHTAFVDVSIANADAVVSSRTDFRHGLVTATKPSRPTYHHHRASLPAIAAQSRSGASRSSSSSGAVVVEGGCTSFSVLVLVLVEVPARGKSCDQRPKQHMVVYQIDANTYANTVPERRFVNVIREQSIQRLYVQELSQPNWAACQ